ncbi:hypothetical protein GCM10023310_06430 [Paenibacillus vulneris]
MDEPVELVVVITGNDLANIASEHFGNAIISGMTEYHDKSISSKKDSQSVSNVLNGDMNTALSKAEKGDDKRTENGEAKNPNSRQPCRTISLGGEMMSPIKDTS